MQTRQTQQYYTQLRRARKRARIIRMLRNAFDHLRPLMVGDTQKGIPPNAEALAGGTIARAMIKVERDR